jgi:predicted double-glycine peptidase
MDIAVALLLTLLLASLAFWCGLKFAPKRGSIALLIFLVLLTLTYAFFAYDHLFWAKILPWSGVAVLGNALHLPLVALIIGLAAPRLPGKPLRRTLLLAPLLLGATWHAFGPLLGEPLTTQVQQIPDKSGVVRQTSEASCSAASAATLLQNAQIPATETELANLCFTRSTGTPMLGTYRGLSIKTKNTTWRVNVLSHATLADLRSATTKSPVLISVGLDRWQRGYDPRYVSEWGWTPGKRHAVVIFGFLPNNKIEKIDIGDPSVGREKWSVESLDTLWNGEGLTLTRASE